MGKRFGTTENVFDAVDEAELTSLEMEKRALVKANIPEILLISYCKKEGNENKHILKKDGYFTQHFFKHFLNLAGRDYDRLNSLHVEVISEGNQVLLDEALEMLKSGELDDKEKEDNLIKMYIEKNSELIKKLDNLNINYISSRDSEDDLNTKLQESAHIISDQVEALKEFIEIFKTHVKEDVDLTENTIKIIKELVK